MPNPDQVTPSPGGFGIYVHWPFCMAKCPYCDFNSHVSSVVDHDAWRRALQKELRRYRSEIGPRTVQSVFFGGGTPSLMEPATVVEVLEQIAGLWSVAEAVEITLEANPTSSERAKFQAFQAAGVTRLSMGIQALNDRDLKALGRTHNRDEALAAFSSAREAFSRVSFDLIYARQHQTLADWQAELSEALSFAVDHLSLYQLTIEQGTAFGARHERGGLRGLPCEDLAADMYTATQELCDAAGMRAYEVSNHARPGAQSRHNLIYWRYGEYLGVGPGAHGRIQVNGRKWATESFLMPQRWLSEVQQGSGESARRQLPAAEQARELLLMGLRLEEGVSLDRLRGLGWEDAGQIAYLRDIGMLRASPSRLIVTPEGRMVLNSVLAELY